MRFTRSRAWISERLILASALTAMLAAAIPAEARTGRLLIVVPTGYATTAPMTELVNGKTAQGLDVEVYTVSSGTNRSTIKSYIESLYGTSAEPDYILLVGDTSGSSTSNSTELPHWSGTGSKGSPTDLPYGAMPGGVSWYIDIPVGRMSVSSTAELQNIVDKVLFVEAGNFPNPEYVKRGAFLANPSTYGMAEPTHDFVIEQLMEPEGYIGIRIYASEGGDTQDVMDALNEGCLFLSYYGHSGSSGWWDPSFGSSNINSLSNTGLYGVASAWSCQTGMFTASECMGETWIRAANKGGVAFIAASDYIYWGSVSAWQPSTDLEKSFYASFFRKDIWEVGPAWKAGLYNFLDDYGNWDGDMNHEPSSNVDICHNFFEEFVILGDPSVLLPQPFGFMLSADPTSQELCSPPDDQAVYQIDVDEMGGFDEAVTLSAADYPAGASVVFSLNSQVPPFTSDMTISGLNGAAAGDYNIIISGDSISASRSIGVELSISSGAPGVVTLTTPTDGETGVMLLPTLNWQTVADAQWYDVEVASDSGFANVVYSTTVSQANCTVDSGLDTLSRYYWHVRAGNPCGDGDYSDAFMFTTVNMIRPAYYDLQNGETGTYSYYDDDYDGDGDNGQSLAWLTNGLGDLTNGVIATQHWNQTNEPYVGWVSIDPVITFHFDAEVSIDTVILYLDDSGGGGGVAAPDDVTIVMGGQTLEFPGIDPPGDEPFAFPLEDLDLTGDTLELTIADHSSSGSYMMLSEVEFYAADVPCVGDLDGDGDVDLSDLAELLAHYGMTGMTPEQGDLDGDGDVDLSDLAELLANYGTICS